MAQPTFVKELVPERSVRDEIYWRQVRRKIRYMCFRLQTEHDPEAPDRKAEGIPRGFKPFFQKQEWFDGWDNFGKTWDVGGPEFAMQYGESDDPLVVVPRWLTVWEENEDEMSSQMRINELDARKRRRGSQSKLQPNDQKD
jgi:hypothetical protein